MTVDIAINKLCTHIQHNVKTLASYASVMTLLLFGLLYSGIIYINVPTQFITKDTVLMCKNVIVSILVIMDIIIAMAIILTVNPNSKKTIKSFQCNACVLLIANAYMIQDITENNTYIRFY